MKQLWSNAKRLRNLARHKAVRDADQARDSGDPARAAALYQVVIDRWGPHFGVLVQLGNALKDSGTFQQAESVYHAALRLSPLDGDCHLQLGHLMKLAGRPDEATSYYREAHRLTPALKSAVVELRAIDAMMSRETEDAMAMAAGVADAGAHLPASDPVVIDRDFRAVLTYQRLLTGLHWRRN